MKALVGAFNQEKALVGAFSVIVQPVVEPMDHYTALFLEPRMTGLSTICPSTSRSCTFRVELVSDLPACTATEKILVSAVTISTGLEEVINV